MPRRQMLSFSKSIFEQLFEFAPDAIFLVNHTGKITIRVNPRGLKMFGFSEQELLQQPVEMLMPERFRDAHPANRSRYAADPNPRPMGIGLGPLWNPKKDGKEVNFPLTSCLSPIESAEGRVVLAVVRDDSEKKRATKGSTTHRAATALRRRQC